MADQLVSIITPVYNAARFVRETISSVQAQTYTDWEMLLVDDGSSDDSWMIIAEIAAMDKRLRLIRLEKNSGAAVARNTAIKEARGRYIAFLDADDKWVPEKLSRQIAFMQETGCALSYTAYYVMREDGQPSGIIIHCPETVSYRQLLMENRIGCLTAIMDVRQCGKLEMPLITKRQDYGLWLTILRNGLSARGINAPLAYYRKYSTSLSGNKWKTIRYNWTLLRDHQGLSAPVAAWYFFLFIANKTVMAVVRKIFR